MPAFLKDGRFWSGVIVGYLLVVMVPQLSFRSKVATAKLGGG